MSAEEINRQVGDHKDSNLYMMLRRTINEEYAAQPVDFNLAGLQIAEQAVGRCLTSEDTIVDIGSNSGGMIADAAIRLGTTARILCVEPDAGAAEAHQRLDNELHNRVHFVQGAGEALPLADNTVTGLTMHNVIFRAKDAVAMLQEAKRVVQSGGYVAISSNAFGHATHRHRFERMVAKEVMQESGFKFPIPRPPAEGTYLEDLPALIAQVGDFELREDLYVSQNTEAVITLGERLDTYLLSIKYSAANITIPARLHSVWRRAVNKQIRPIIERKIQAVLEAAPGHDVESVPCFADPIRRGMYVLVNRKCES